MLHLMQKEAQHKDHEEADCFVCVVCSHGNSKGILGTGGQKDVLTIVDLTSCMDGKHCKTLRNKPKLFIIQACQGEDEDVVSDFVDVDQDLDERFWLTDGDEDIARDAMNVLTKSDMVVAAATHPGYACYRNQTYGSWYIQAVILVFQTFAHKDEVCVMLTKLAIKPETMYADKKDLVLFEGDLLNPEVEGGRRVNNLLSKATAKKQASQYQSSLRRQLFFFPGVFEVDVPQDSSTKISDDDLNSSEDDSLGFGSNDNQVSSADDSLSLCSDDDQFPKADTLTKNPTRVCEIL